MKHARSPVAPLAVVLSVAALALPGCMPESGPRDGRHAPAVAPGVEEATAALEVEFLWPEASAEVTDEAVRLDEIRRLPLRVRLHNPGRYPIAVELDDLLMRPVDDSVDPEEGFVEAVFHGPPALTLAPDETRELGYGEVWLFLGFACTLHVSGEVRQTGGAGGRASFAHRSRPILVGE